MNLNRDLIYFTTIILKQITDLPKMQNYKTPSFIGENLETLGWAMTFHLFIYWPYRAACEILDP